LIIQQNLSKRNNLKYIFILFVLFFSFCKKEKKEISYSFKGVISDSNNNTGIEGAQITIFKREVSSGTFNSAFSQEDTYTASESGAYELKSDFGTIESFKFKIEKENYFTIEKTFNPDDFRPNEVNQLDFSLIGKGVVSIRIKNNIPFDLFDEISFNSLNPSCNTCVKFNSIVLKKMQVDTTLTGNVEANRYFKFQYSVKKNNTTSNYLDSVFCVLGDTSFYVLNY
jgi:hypothetical protein